jgi:hypothetical protein
VTRTYTSQPAAGNVDRFEDGSAAVLAHEQGQGLQVTVLVRSDERGTVVRWCRVE